MVSSPTTRSSDDATIRDDVGRRVRVSCIEILLSRREAGVLFPGYTNNQTASTRLERGAPSASSAKEGNPVRAYRVIALALVTVALVYTSAAQAEPRPRPVVPASKIASEINATWRCQDNTVRYDGTRAPRSKVQTPPWNLPRNHYREWVLNRWTILHKNCEKALHAHDPMIRRLNTGIEKFYDEAHSGYRPMSGLGATLERVGRHYNLSPYFFFAASVTEASGGIAACANNDYNVWGLSSCGSGWRVPPQCARLRPVDQPADCWDGWADAVDFYARFLLGRVGVSGGWPSATTTYSFVGYAKCSSCWGATTARHMSHLFGVDNSVRYPWDSSGRT